MSLKTFAKLDTGYSDDLLLRRISVEAAGNPVSALATLTALSASIRDRLKEMVGVNNKLADVKVNPRTLEKALSKQNYMYLTALYVYRPVGLQCSFMDLLDVLTGQQENLLAIEKRIIEPFMRWTAESLTDPSKLKRLNPVANMSFMDAPKAQKALNDLFDNKDTSDTYGYGKAVARNGEWGQVVAKLRERIKAHNTLPPSKLLKRLGEVSDRCELITQRIEEAPDMYSPSRGTIDALAQVTYKMAEEFELYSRHSYLLKSLTTAIDDSADKLIELNKKSTVSNEGIGRQMAGGVKDHYTFKSLRDVLKVSGWTGWDIDRVLSGIDTIERDIIGTVEQYAKRSGTLKNTIPREALDSLLAWGGNQGVSPFIVDEGRYKKLLKAIDADVDVLAINQGSVIDNIVEGFSGKSLRRVVLAEVKTYSDLIKFYRKCADRSRTIVKRSVNSEGKLPKAFFAKHFIGVNALVELAGQIRSVVRRAD